MHHNPRYHHLLVNQRLDAAVVPDHIGVAVWGGDGAGVCPALACEHHAVVGAALHHPGLVRVGQQVAQAYVQGVGCGIRCQVLHRQRAVLKAHVSHQHLRAVGGGGRGLAILGHAVCGCAHHVVAGQLDFGQAQIGQAAHFARVAHAVLVGVLPHHELAKLRILRIELAGLGVKRRHQALQVGVATVPLTDLNLLKQ